ncbi:MAG: C40 family peptidase [Lachnospiraceae bacterium]|nr:C40 family peptidase [Lachnospiraceae bacterium]
MKKSVFVWSLTAALFLAASFPVFATGISEIRQKQQQLQEEQQKTRQELEAISGEISGMESHQQELESQLEALDAQLVELMASVSLIEEEITNKEIEIEEARIQYEEAQAEETAQYEAMKTRIRFMYERGDRSYLELLLQSEGLADMINKADYVEKLYAFDRELLLKFQAAREAVALAKQALEEEQAMLEEQQHQLKEEEEALEAVLDTKRREAEDYEMQLARARQEAAAYKARIKQQNAEIKKLEEAARKKAEEEARKQAEAAAASGKNQGKESGSNYTAAIDSSSGSATGKEIANYACQFIGNPYVYGGTSLTNGADCSGFVMSVYKNFGYSLPRSSSGQRGAGREVSFADAQPGDIVCYAGHVGIYIGGGQIVHASTVKTGIKISNVTYKPVICIRRIV